MMKKLTKILILVLSLALLVGAVVLTASAAEKSYEFDPDNDAFVVYMTKADFEADLEANKSIAKDADKYPNKLGGVGYNNPADAISAASAAGAKYVALQRDWENGTKVYDTATVVLSINNMILDLNGYTMSFSVFNGFNNNGTISTAYQFLSVGASNVTVVGNGGTLEGVMALIQNATPGRTLNLVGGDRGSLTIRAITGKDNKTNPGTLADYTGYSGGDMIKIGGDNWSTGTQTNYLNVLGEVHFERANTTCSAAIAYWGSSVVNIGTADGEKSYVTMTDLTGTEGIGTEANGNALVRLGMTSGFDVSTKNPYKSHTNSSKLNIVNTDITLVREKLYYADVYFYRLTQDAQTNPDSYKDDMQYVRIEDSKILLNGYANDDIVKNNSSKVVPGLIRTERLAPVCIDIVNSHLENNARSNIFNYVLQSGGSDAAPGISRTLLSWGYINCVDSTIVTKRCDASTKGWPISANVGGLVFDNCSLFYGEAVASAGTAWLPYGNNFADGSAPVWAPFSKDFGGSGILVKAGCTLLSGSKESDLGNSSAALKKPGQWVTGYSANTCTLSGSSALVTAYDLNTNTSRKIIVDKNNPGSIVTSFTGINTFDSAIEGTIYRDKASVPKFGGSLTWQVTSGSNPRNGMLTINASKKFSAEKGLESTSNKYVTHNFWKDTAGTTYGTDYYAWTGAPTFEKTTTSTAPTIDIRDSQYYTVDFDLMTTADTFTGMYFTIYVKSYFTDEAADASTNKYPAHSDMIRLDMDGAGKWVAAAQGKDSYTMDFAPGVWQHMTFVLEMPTKTVTTTVNNVEVTETVIDVAAIYKEAVIHVYIDGQYKDTVEGVVPNGYMSKTNTDLDYCSVNDVRVGFANGTKDNPTPNTSIDNFSHARYPIGMTRDEVAAYMTNVQEKLGIESPANLPFSTYKTEAGYRTADQAFISDFIVNALFGEPYQDYTLYTDATGVIDLDAIAQSYDIETFEELVETLTDDGTFSFSIKTNGRKLEFSENPYIQEYDAATKTLTLRTATEDEKLTITFDDLDPATENVTIKVLPGKTVKADAFPEALKVTYQAQYTKLVVNGWATEKYGTALTEIEMGEEDITLYPAVKVVSELPEIYVSVFASDIISFRFYIPAELVADMKEDTIADFVLLNDARYSYNGGKNVNTGIKLLSNSSDVYMIGDKGYYVRDLWPGLENFASDTQYIIDYNVVYDGVTIKASATYAISALGYCEYVLDNAEAYEATEVDVAANYLRYGYEYLNALATLNPTKDAYAATAATIKASYDEYVAAGVNFSEYEKDLLAYKEGVTDASDLGKYADLSVSINNSRLQLVIKAKSGAQIKGISVTTVGWVSDGNGLANNSEKVYVSSASNYKADAETGLWSEYRTTNIAQYNTFGVFTVVFTLADDTQVSGTVSMADYYNGLVAQGAPNTEVYANLFYAIKELGDAIVANRFEER